jgi:hypothetical protein
MDTTINKPKNFDSNKLINPDIEEDSFDEDADDEMEDEEMDDETKQIINKMRMKYINMEDKEFIAIPSKTISTKKIIDKIDKKISKKNMSLQDFVKITPSESKPIIKKFTSNRIENKKKQTNDILIPKRQFNPRKPPFNFIRKENKIENIQYNSSSEFPELK